MNLHTFNDGACAERSAIIAHVRRHIRRLSPRSGAAVFINAHQLLDWLHGRVARNAARPGGLGRKKG